MYAMTHGQKLKFTSSLIKEYKKSMYNVAEIGHSFVQNAHVQWCTCIWWWHVDIWLQLSVSQVKTVKSCITVTDRCIYNCACTGIVVYTCI